MTVAASVGQESPFKKETFKNKATSTYYNAHFQFQADLNKVIVVLTDITETKKLEQLKLKDMQNKLRNLYYASVAHDLRTPLNSILPLTDLIASKTKDPETLRFLKIIKNSANHLSNLVEDTLDMSRIENGQF